MKMNMSESLDTETGLCKDTRRPRVSWSGFKLANTRSVELVQPMGATDAHGIASTAYRTAWPSSGVSGRHAKIAACAAGFSTFWRRTVRDGLGFTGAARKGKIKCKSRFRIQT